MESVPRIYNEDPQPAQSLESRLKKLKIIQIHGARRRVDVIGDTSPRHILQEIASARHTQGGFVLAEDERNLDKLVAPSPAWYSLDAVYSDDFCLSVQVVRGDCANRADFDGSPEEMAAECGARMALPRPGEPSARGPAWKGFVPSGALPLHFLSLQTRSGWEPPQPLDIPEASRAASALLLLSPFTPLPLLGQDRAASTPFRSITDDNPQRRALAREGRRWGRSDATPAGRGVAYREGARMAAGSGSCRGAPPEFKRG